MQFVSGGCHILLSSGHGVIQRVIIKTDGLYILCCLRKANELTNVVFNNNFYLLITMFVFSCK